MINTLTKKIKSNPRLDIGLEMLLLALFCLVLSSCDRDKEALATSGHWDQGTKQECAYTYPEKGY